MVSRPYVYFLTIVALERGGNAHIEGLEEVSSMRGKAEKLNMMLKSKGDEFIAQVRAMTINQQ